jgi:hypothetical protein
MTTQSMAIPQHLASFAEDCFDASEGIRELFGPEAYDRPSRKPSYRGMRGFAAASFISFPLPALTIRLG